MKPNSGVESHWTLIAVSYLLLRLDRKSTASYDELGGESRSVIRHLPNGTHTLHMGTGKTIHRRDH